MPQIQIDGRMLDTQAGVVANLDEGDPGAYIESLHYRGRSVRAPELALTEARSGRLLGSRVLDTDFSFDIELILTCEASRSDACVTS